MKIFSLYFIAALSLAVLSLIGTPAFAAGSQDVISYKTAASKTALPICQSDQAITFIGGSFQCVNNYKNAVCPPPGGNPNLTVIQSIDNDGVVTCTTPGIPSPVCAPNQVITGTAANGTPICGFGVAPVNCGVGNYIASIGPTGAAVCAPVPTIPNCTGIGSVLTSLDGATFSCMYSNGVVGVNGINATLTPLEANCQEDDFPTPTAYPGETDLNGIHDTRRPNTSNANAFSSWCVNACNALCQRTVNASTGGLYVGGTITQHTVAGPPPLFTNPVGSPQGLASCSCSM